MKSFFLSVAFVICLFATGYAQNDCSITNLTATEVSCNENGETFTLVLDFDYANTNQDHFHVVGANGVQIGTYAYADLPVTITNMNVGTSGNIVIHVVNVNNTACHGVMEMPAPACEEPCSITNVHAYDVVCNENGEGFTLLLDFDFANVGGQNGFDVFGPGNVFLGYYLYANLPITINNFPNISSNGMTYIKVQNNDNADCFAFDEFEVPTCTTGDCSITNLTATEVSCNENGETFTLVLDFDYANTNQDHFHVVGANGVQIGTYAYADLPVTITNMNVGTSGNIVIHVVNVNNTACNGVLEMPAPDCPTTDCSITNLTATEVTCNENGETFTLVLDFDYANTNQTSFKVFGANNTLIGTFLYADLPITINNMNVSVFNNLVIKVVNFENPACFGIMEMPAPPCSESCSITNVHAYDVVCNDNGDGLTLILDFDYANTNQTGFDLIGPGGVALGYYLYANLPIIVTNFPNIAVNGMTYIKVQNNDNADCFGIDEFELPECPGDLCSITNITATEVTCNENGETFNLVLDFDYANTNQDSFRVVGANNTFIGKFAYADLPITITNMNVSVFNNIVIKVNNVEEPTCFGVLEMPAPDCPVVGCPIEEVFFSINEVSACQYYISLDSFLLNFTDESFNIALNDGSGEILYITTLFTADLPFEIPTLIFANGGSITFQSANYLDCVFELDLSSCTGSAADLNSSIRLLTSDQTVRLEGVNPIQTGWYNMLGQTINPTQLTETSWGFNYVPAGMYLLYYQDVSGRQGVVQYVRY
jgi:uncharacterized protein with PQ loop repeat